jgi:hypothetical protein
MRRPPEALERERRVAALIAEANRARDPSPSEKRFKDLIEDPAFHSSTVANRPLGRPRIGRKLSKLPDPEPESRFLAIRRHHQKRQKSLFRRILRELFLAIANTRAIGPLEPEDIELPEAPSYRRLCFNPDGTGRIEGGDYWARLQELYALLHGLDLTRFRVCPSCKQLFWASRSDQVGCRTDCANRIRSARCYYNSKARTDNSDK